jgi:hypothetical protein
MPRVERFKRDVLHLERISLVDAAVFVAGEGM